MGTRHVAYGLALDARLPLAGMPVATADRLPELTLERVEPAALDKAWSGASGPPAWRGRLGDGCELAIENGARGDTLFHYGDRARFRLDARRERLESAPLRAGLHWQQVLLGRILPNVAIMRGYEALHASSVDSPQGVVAIAGPSGMGKTTLALELMRRSWPLFADDVLILGHGAAPGKVHAYPGTPHMNVAEGPYGEAASAQLGTTLGTLAGERWMALRATAAQPRPVRLICLFERGPDRPLAVRTVPPSPLPLAPYMLGLAGDAERGRARFARYADLMCDTALIRLTSDTDDAPAKVADLIEQALADAPALVAGGIG
jgi:hypothetical protein